MKIKIRVTKEILKEAMYCKADTCVSEEEYNAKKGIMFNCAISKAICKLMPEAITLNQEIVYYGSFERFANSDGISIPLPVEAQEFINYFDKLSPEARIRMSPISFEIDIPEAIIDQIGIQEVENILSKSLTLEKV